MYIIMLQLQNYEAKEFLSTWWSFHAMQRVPDIRGFWNLKKTELPEICISGASFFCHSLHSFAAIII